ncbi:lipopolysaccharide heptosyltransferase I [Azospira restricta]|uniref:Lipopolysaccharide heptosyltransferase 1 n=1 Tax=Azospira restricta TaxID=404405 RepID=A0A974Y3U3_9RHOO|nr:lipopolysaccharide heptosyltransferase I [Azospira restricta]QRJ64080.1 lipopolysaccharide heptosyltransferase I [Azospira restricta]
MRILLVKTSSLGDVIHNLPVAADLARQIPGIEIDWCVEESFADIPRLSPAVRETIPVAVRRWRKRLFSGATWREIGALRRRLAGGGYDAVLDTQGLLKSALIATLAAGRRLGHDRNSAREPLAARFYDQTFAVPRELHAVERNRRLAAAAFGYAPPPALDYGIAAPAFAAAWLPETPLAVLLTATSRDDKLWPEADWIALGRALEKRGLSPILPAGNAVERERAARIAAAIPGAVAAPPLSIRELAGVLGRARLAVGVDTGLAHLAAALQVPTVALYTATEPALTGVAGAGFARNLGGAGRPPAVGEVLATADEALSG